MQPKYTVKRGALPGTPGCWLKLFRHGRKTRTGSLQEALNFFSIFSRRAIANLLTRDNRLKTKDLLCSPALYRPEMTQQSLFLREADHESDSAGTVIVPHSWAAALQRSSYPISSIWVRIGSDDSPACHAFLHPDFENMVKSLKRMVGPARFERATLCLEGRCSIQLSYGPVRFILAAP